MSTLALTTACDPLTPPLSNPVTHDIVLVSTSSTTLSSMGGYDHRVLHDTVVTTLIVDFGTTGAQISSSAVCGPTRGTATVSGSSFAANFEIHDGASLAMKGTIAGDGSMSGTFSCETENSPSYPVIEGTFQATRRP